MPFENSNKQLTNIELSGSQKHISEEITHEVSDKLPKSLIIIEGLPGVGKTFLVESLNKTSLERVTFLDPELVSRNIGSYPDDIIVTSRTIGEMGPDLKELAVNDERPVQVKILKGLNKQEILRLVPTQNIPDNLLTPEQIADLSLGVPLLAKQLIHPGLDVDTALRIVAKYLVQSLGKSLNQSQLEVISKKYLQLPIPPNVIEMYLEISKFDSSDHIYDDLHPVLARMDQYGEKSPLFLARESQEIYDTMLQNPTNNTRTQVDIFVPRLTRSQLELIQKSFGWSGHDYNDNLASRLQMFLTQYRKEQIVHQDEGDPYSEPEYAQNAFRRYMTIYENDELGIPFEGYSREISFYISSFDHNGLVHKPARIGWMTESLLQQLGIPYFANNYIYGKAYTYDPEKQEIIEQDELI